MIIAITALSVGLCVTPILVSNCPIWTAFLSVPVPLVLSALLIYYKKKQWTETNLLLNKVDHNVKNFLFNNGQPDSVNALIDLDKNLKQATTFIKQIGEGNFQANYTGMTNELREVNRNNLSGELLQMKDRMIKVADEERQRSWVAGGVAHFSEIARAQNKSFEQVITLFISELVKYMNANQGAIFVVNDRDPSLITLDLLGCYAYGRRKYIEKQITPGEGLVGQAFLEGDIIYLTDVPANYVSITSGLGEATPRCVILVPLKNHETIEGILEIASFTIWQKFESDFLIKVGEILGSAIATIKVNEQTKRLLTESQSYAEQLKIKEEEMRQSLEELSATQEAMAAKSQEAVAQNNKLNAVLDSTADAIITLGENGSIESVNRSFNTLFDYTEEEIGNKNLADLISPRDPEKRAEFLGSCMELSKTKIFSQRIEMRKKAGDFFSAEALMNSTHLGDRLIYTLIIRDVTELIKAEHDQLQYIEELRAQEEELKQNMEELQATQEEIHRQMKETNKANRELDARVLALNTSTIMSESDLFGNITYVNDKFCEVSQYSREELIGEPHNLLRHPDMPKEVFALLWRNIKGGKVFRGIVKNKKKDGTHYWVDAVISPVLSEEGKPEKYIGVRYVIEDEELANKLYQQQLMNLRLIKEPERIAA